MTTEARGEIFDLGYQHYDGPREGRARVIRSLWVNGFRTALGLGRGAKAKILPLLMFFFVTAPAAIIVLIASIVGPEAEIPSHAEYYQVISILLLLFSAIIAPELLIPDRRDGVISLYLVRPLTATDYIASRWSAFFFITLILAYAGQVLLLLGFVLAAEAPVDYLRDNWLDIPRFLASGAVVALFVTTIPMAISSFTTRRAYAAAVVIAIFVITAPMAWILTSCEERHETVVVTPGGQRVVLDSNECEPLTGDWAKWFALVDVGRAPQHISDIIFNEENNEDDVSRLVGDLNTAIPVVWYLLLVLGPGAALYLRYRKMTI